MKKNNLISLINNILIGISAILYLLYNNFISIAAMAASFIENTFSETNTAIEIANIIIYNGLFTIIIFSILTIINYFLSKKSKNKISFIFLILLILTLIVLIIKNIGILI